MKNLLTLTLAVLATATTLLAQVPQAMKYQSVIRNAAGEALVNTNVGLRFTILEDGSDVYQETYDLNTNAFGLVNLNLGEGTTADNFGAISWDDDSYSLRVELDTNGGSNYQVMGESSMLTVPFAMRAQTVVDNDDADADPSNELQSLSLNGTTLSISSGNSVTLPEGGDAVDTDQIAKAWARVEIDGTSNASFDSHGVTTTSKVNTGVYIVSFSPGLFSVATNPAMVASVINDLAPGIAVCTYGAAPSQVQVRTYDMNGSLSDRAFSLIVFGE